MLAYILTFLSFIYYFAGSGLLSLSLHNSAWDLGIFNQVLYNTATGQPFFYSFRPFSNYLGDHFSPILIFFAPLSLFKSSLPLLFVQSLFLALAVFVLYRLSRVLLESKIISLAIAFSFAVNPFTLNIVNFDWHPDFAFPLLFFAALYFLAKFLRRPELGSGSAFDVIPARELGSRTWIPWPRSGRPGHLPADALPEAAATLQAGAHQALQAGARNDNGVVIVTAEKLNLSRRKYLIFTFVCVILLQLVREDAFLLIIPLAVIFFWQFRQKKLALLTLVFTLSYTVTVLFFIMPGIRGGASSPLAEHYPYLGKSVGEVAQNVLNNPGELVSKVFGEEGRLTLIKFLGSTGFTSLLSPQIMVLSLPIFASHLLSIIPMRINLEGHYPSQLLAFMYVAVVFGLENTSSKFKNQSSKLQMKIKNFIILHCHFDFCILIFKFLRNIGRKFSLSVVVSLYLVAVSVVSFTLFSPFPPSLSANVDRFTVTGHHQLFWQLVKLIPDNVPVSAQTNLVPALAFRKDVFEFPDLRDADYVLLDAYGSVARHSLDLGFYQKERNLTNEGFSLIKDEDGFKIYKKDTVLTF